ncbi:ABC transporter substrate-binding protein [Fervidobacterium ngatamarikiense]|uniref:ABC transporter substrate-binding protein n=1 Tax=Fervidobacterium pennivorans TaxID=93466 RepID=A0A172T3N8_FERPE|nr:ABC transporter substrate-binding protein [Fervidobacterium pennivorans]ANE41638.1 ABC transporter substrate-binding protein [Fervidobacterium pennivorans]
MKRFFLLALFAVVLTTVIFADVVYKRDETLYAGGGLWAPPSNWNPITPWNAVTGTVGLIYETLYGYDPLKDELIPWLAESGKWTSKNSFEIKLRKGVTWHDGMPFTSKDVKFTLELAKKIPEISYSYLWNWIAKVDTPDDYTVVFTFSSPRYHEWNYQLYQLPIIPEHIWSKMSKDEILTGANEKAIGTGPYMPETYSDDRMVYLRNDNWWGNKIFGQPKPKRIVYLRVLSNNVALGMIMKGELDISNFFLPGVPTLKKTYSDIHTWFAKEPYMLSDNTAFLFINTTKKPLNDPNLRRAMAYAIDPNIICRTVFEGQVLPSNPVGFLPIKGWMKYYPENAVKQFGFKYDPKIAKDLLDKAGYKDINKDGYREAPDGSKFKVSIIVPFGWTDWMESIKLIASQLRAVGINAEAQFPDFSKYWEDLTSGNFDMAINNFNSQMSVSPWTMFNWLFNSNFDKYMYNGNFGRYNNPKLFDLITQLNSTPMEDIAANKKIVEQIAEIFLKDMPAIPLWYNGMWFQASTQVWKNWPSEKNPYAYPVTWGGRWQTGGVLMLIGITSK